MRISSDLHAGCLTVAPHCRPSSNSHTLHCCLTDALTCFAYHTRCARKFRTGMANNVSIAPPQTRRPWRDTGFQIYSGNFLVAICTKSAISIRNDSVGVLVDT
eukprot:730737-Rhodomonas_salina.4